MTALPVCTALADLDPLAARIAAAMSDGAWMYLLAEAAAEKLEPARPALRVVR